MSSGEGCIRLGPRLPKSLIRISIVAGVALAAGSVAELLRAKPTPSSDAVDDTGETEGVDAAP